MPSSSARAQACVRIGSAAPLVTVWESLHEYGVPPSDDTAVAAVGAAVEGGDGPSARRLLLLVPQYLRTPPKGLAAGVLRLLGEGEEAERLRALLPDLGLE